MSNGAIRAPRLVRILPNARVKLRPTNQRERSGPDARQLQHSLARRLTKVDMRSYAASKTVDQILIHVFVVIRNIQAHNALPGDLFAELLRHGLKLSRCETSRQLMSAPRPRVAV